MGFIKTHWRPRVVGWQRYTLAEERNQFHVPVCQEGEEGNFKPCLIEDEGGPLEAAMQVEASNHRKLLW